MIRSKLRLIHLFSILLILLVKGLWAQDNTDNDDKVSIKEFPTPLFVSDSVLILPPAADSFNSNDTLFLLRGTEVKDKFIYDGDKLVSPKQYSARTSIQEEDYTSFPQPWIKEFMDINHVLPFFYWRKGIEFNSEYLKVYRSWPNWFFKTHYELSYRTGNDLLMGGGAVFFQAYGGSLINKVQKDNPDAYSIFGWSITGGVPALRFELRAAPWPLPEYSWFEERLDTLVEQKTSGEFLKIYKDDRSDISTFLNKSYSFIFKAGVLRYKFLMDYDIYKNAVHDIMLKDMPFLFGSWSMGITGAGKNWVPGVRMSFLRLDSLFVNWLPSKPKFSADPLVVSFNFHKLNNYYFSIRFRVRLSDLLSNYFGATK